MIEIREVTSKKDLKKFISFPIKLYKNNQYFVPAIFEDEMNNFNEKKNPAYEYAETRLFLAYKDGKIAGRVCGLINHAYNKKKGFNQIRFTRLDMIDDIDVTKALLDKVMEWGRERGLTEMIGPIGFSDLDKQGMLVDGFEEMSNWITIYNFPYYKEHLDKLGLVKDADWIEYQVFTPKEENERISRVANLIQKRYGYEVVKLKNKKEVIPYTHKAFELINEAFEPLYGVVPLTEKQIEDFIDQFVPLVNLDYLFVINNKDGELIGFGLLVPSLSQALRKSKGKLFPFGFFRVLKALKKNDVLDMYIIAVKPEYQKKGVNALILCEGIKAAIRNGVKYSETGPELENNTGIVTQWNEFETRQHRRRRCFKITL